MIERYIVSGPIVEIAIVLKRTYGRELLRAQLGALAAADRSCSYSAGDDYEVLRGTSETHLERLVAAVKAAKFDVVTGAPQVVYRECVTRTVDVDHTHKRLVGASGEFARVRLRFAPAEPDAGIVFENLARDAVPREYDTGVVKALAACKDNGVLVGYPLTGFKASLLDGAYHEGDSSVSTFEVATRDAFRLASKKGAVALLEPIMAATVDVPEWLLDVVAGDLSANRGVIDEVVERDDWRNISSHVPLAGLLGYAQRLALLTRHQGKFSMRYSHHAIAQLPGDGTDRFRPAAAMRA